MRWHQRQEDGEVEKLLVPFLFCKNSRHSLPYHNTTRYAQREGEGLASKDGKAAVDPRLRGAALGVGSEVSRPVAAEDDDFGFIPIRRNDGLGLAIKENSVPPFIPTIATTASSTIMIVTA